jgi:type IX secretion system PorP/SprF family membrane protein
MSAKNKHIILLVLGLLIFISESSAQVLPANNQYFVNPYTLSPAFAGYNYKSEIYAGYRRQWTKMPGSPKTAFVSLVAPVWPKVWLGGYIYNDQSSIFNNFNASVSYTYKLQIAEKHLVRFGGNLSLRQNSISLLNANIADANDPLLQDKLELTGTSLNAGFGFLYQNTDLMLGFSIPNLFVSQKQYETESTNNLVVLERSYQLYGMYQKELNPLWKLKTSLVIKATKYSPVNLDLLAMADYKNTVWAGMFFRSSSVIGFTVGGYIIDNITLDYSYEFSNNGFTQYTSGTNEISIGFDIRWNKYEKSGQGLNYPTILRYNKKYRK